MGHPSTVLSVARGSEEDSSRAVLVASLHRRTSVAARLSTTVCATPEAGLVARRVEKGPENRRCPHSIAAKCRTVPNPPPPQIFSAYLHIDEDVGPQPADTSVAPTPKSARARSGAATPKTPLRPVHSPADGGPRTPRPGAPGRTPRPAGQDFAEALAAGLRAAAAEAAEERDLEERVAAATNERDLEERVAAATNAATNATSCNGPSGASAGPQHDLYTDLHSIPIDEEAADATLVRTAIMSSTNIPRYSSMRALSSDGGRAGTANGAFAKQLRAAKKAAEELFPACLTGDGAVPDALVARGLAAVSAKPTTFSKLVHKWRKLQVL